MRFNRAKQLHNEDEVIYKKTKETLTVLNTYEETNPITNNPQIIIEAVNSENQLIKVNHKEIK